jgi:tetratricopeptide (TPR) repeat protein
MADSLSGAASIYFLQGDFEGAEALYLQALKVREDALGANHPDIVRTLEALAAVYGKLKQPPDAARFADRAAKIRAANPKLPGNSGSAG